MDRNKTHFDLRDAFGGDGCPVCALALASVEQYFAGLNYEAAGDRGVRARLRQSLGFCTPHAHRWLAVAHVLATATIYAEVLAQTRDELRSLTFRRSGPRFPSFRRPRDGTTAPAERDDLPQRTTASCPACIVLADSDRMLIATLLAGLGDAEFSAAFAASQGLCLPHLRRALAQAPNETSFALLRDAAVAQEEGLLGHLREVIRKHDYRFTEELAGDERGAGERAIRHVVGDAGAA